MTFDPALVVALIVGMGALIVLIFRAFASGAILPRNAVPREDFEAMRAIAAGYAAPTERLTEAVRVLTELFKRQYPNGGK